MTDRGSNERASHERPPALADFPVQTADKVRYADTDRQGHVNNAVFATFLETGRVEILYRPERPLAAQGASFVIARLALDFMDETRWPGTIQIGTGVVRIGNSSVHLIQGLFQDDRAVARASTVIVHVDSPSKRSSPLGESARAALQR